MPRTPNHSLHQQIRDSLAQGLKYDEIERSLGCSSKTIKLAKTCICNKNPESQQTTPRVKKITPPPAVNPEIDEFGWLYIQISAAEFSKMPRFLRERILKRIGDASLCV